MKTKSAVGKWRTNEIAEQKTIFIDGNDGAVAWVFNGYGINDNDRANASLIASAPELLEALKLAYKALDTDTEQNPQDTILMETIECAIAKSEGRA